MTAFAHVLGNELSMKYIQPSRSPHRHPSILPSIVAVTVCHAEIQEPKITSLHCMHHYASLFSRVMQPYVAMFALSSSEASLQDGGCLTFGFVVVFPPLPGSSLTWRQEEEQPTGHVP